MYFTEKPTSGATTATPPTLTKNYTAYPVVDETDLMATAYVLTAPAIATPYGILYRQDIRTEPEGADQHHVIVPYAQKEKETGSFTISFDTTGGTVNRKVSISTPHSYAAEGVAGDVPDFNGAIDVQTDNTVNGVDIVIPALKLNVSFKHPQGIISHAQIRAIARATGCVNSQSFIGFDPGEVLLLGATGEEGSDTETTVSYQLACSENIAAQQIGPFANVTKAGWDVIWVKFKEEEADGKPVVTPEYMYVEQVYQRKNLKQILGFG